MTSSESLTQVVLRLENGTEMSFRGRLFAEAMWHDGDTETTTHHRLYATETGEHVYALMKSCGRRRACRAYRVSTRGNRCTVWDGRDAAVLPLQALTAAIRLLCGRHAGEFAEQAEAMLRSASV